MKQYFQVGNRKIAVDDSSLEQALASVHGTTNRPKCMCTPEGVEMYVAKVGKGFILKRMPSSSTLHNPMCPSYEPPPELSGIGELMGTAIQEDPSQGITSLKINFPLAKTIEKPTLEEKEKKEEEEKEKEEKEEKESKPKPKKLSLGSFLDYLWEESKLCRWSPAMEGKRNWYTVRKYLSLALLNKKNNKLDLSEITYIPESFSLEKKDEIIQRRTAAFARTMVASKKKISLNLFIGEVKEFIKGEDYQVVIKHMPDKKLLLPAKVAKKALALYEEIIDLWQSMKSASQEPHLVIMATFACNKAGIPQVESVAFMLTLANWIPINDSYEKMVLELLVERQYHFMKTMRYNISEDQPLAIAVLPRIEPKPVALYVTKPGMSDDYQTTLDKMIANSQMDYWIWDVALGHMPALPALSS